MLIVPSHPSYRVTWLPWLLRGSRRVSEVVTGLCLETFSRSMSGTESECWSPEPGAGALSPVLGKGPHLVISLS